MLAYARAYSSTFRSQKQLLNRVRLQLHSRLPSSCSTAWRFLAFHNLPLPPLVADSSKRLLHFLVKARRRDLTVLQEASMQAGFQLRRRNIEDPVRGAAPGIQLRQGKNCEIVVGTGLRSPASVKLGNPETSGRTFDLRVAVPIGMPILVTHSCVSEPSQLCRLAWFHSIALGCHRIPCRVSYVRSTAGVSGPVSPGRSRCWTQVPFRLDSHLGLQ